MNTTSQTSSSNSEIGPALHELNKLILQTLGEFQRQAIAKGLRPALADFAQFFEKRNNVALKEAIKSACFRDGEKSRSMSAKPYLLTVPGVEVFQIRMLDCVRIAGTRIPVAEARPTAPRTSGKPPPFAGRPGQKTNSPIFSPGSRARKTSYAGKAFKRFGGKQFDAEAARRYKEAIKKCFPSGADAQRNSLLALPPSSSWTMLVDDTGETFTPGEKTHGRGRMVAVFVPADVHLPSLPKGWHANDLSRAGNADEVVRVAGLLAKSRCGIVGVSVEDLPVTTASDQWFCCLDELISLSLRLLPLDGETKILLRAEQHGGISAEEGNPMLKKTIDDVLYRLKTAFPDRAAKIHLRGAFVTKSNPLIGYADAAAYVWGSDKSALRTHTGWKGACFLEGNSSEAVRRGLDALRMEGAPSAADWNELLSLPEAQSETSLVAAFLGILGHEAKVNLETWRIYFNEARRHLDSKAIRMDLLGRQLRWLKQWMPDGEELPPRTRLMWLVSELAAANHSGRTNMHETKSFRSEFDGLVSRLQREDCPLCALANLHLAVSYTNAFEFGKTRYLLLPMCKWPIEGLGLRMEGRLLSSLGQHEAFAGNYREALPLFDKAISIFRDLSEGSAGEISHTSSYAAVAAMDAGTPDADERLAAYIWEGSFSEDKFATEARRLATSAEPVEKYMHHVLLRRLVELPEDHPARMAYLAEKERWSVPDVGHPWELVEFYRALLLPAGEERLARLDDAFAIATGEGGPTLQVISAVIMGSALCEGANAVVKAYEDLVSRCAENVPALGKARLAALRGQLDPATRLSPLALAKAVLPFNFR